MHTNAPARPPLSAARAEELRAGARFELGRRNIATAETLCREILDTFPEDAECWNMIGVIGAELRLFEQALAAFERALRADPSFEKAAGNRDQIAAAPVPPHRPATDPGLLVIKAWGQGFWSDVDHVLGQLLVAELTGRVPVTHWGENSRFGKPGAPDAFTLYFEPLSSRSIDELRDRPDSAFWPPKWSGRNIDTGEVQKLDGEWSRVSGLFGLGRPEEIVVSDYYTGIATIAPWISPDHALARRDLPALYRFLCDKYLRPRRELLARIDDQVRGLFSDREVLAVHARGTDKFAESQDLAAANRGLLAKAGEWAAGHPDGRVFLLSDSSPLVIQFRQSFGDRLIALPAQRSGSDVAVHFQSRNGHSLGLEIMTDTYLALRAGWFLGNGESNVSAMIEHLRDWPPGRFQLVAPSLHYRRHLV
jgi:protein O-GlcNAc transferase